MTILHNTLHTYIQSIRDSISEMQLSITSTRLIHFIAFAYMLHEKEDNIYWALYRCHDLLKSPNISPEVIVTDL